MQPVDGLERHGKHKNLYVVLHQYCGSPKALLPIRRAIRKIDPDADIYAPRMPFAGRFFGLLCLRDATTVICRLITAIDRIVEDRNAQGGEGYRAINLVGHSIGAVFARKIAIVAHGEIEQAAEDRNLYAPFEPAFAAWRNSPRSWAPRIGRIVLMAGMNRGWSPSSAMNWWVATSWRLFTAIGETVFGGTPIIFDIRQGAVFSVQTRLQWLALMHRNRKARPDIRVIQLLGAIDDMVSPDDSVDYAVDVADEPPRDGEHVVRAVDQSYFYLEVPQSTHNNIIQLVVPDAPQDWKEPSPGERRKLSGAATRRLNMHLRGMEFWRALTLSRTDLQRRAVRRSEMSDSLPPAPDWKVTDVVFVIHGIRDKGFWTQKIARAIKEEAAGRSRKVGDRTVKMDVRSVTTSYGYFAMAPFVLWWIRKGKAEWLMDQYTEARAHYPRADFSYVGHSNGTYLVARALRDYPAARFKRIVLAGSVVRPDYPWLERIRRGQVEQVLNYVATNDRVLAFLTNGMRLLDLGSAGHKGFREASPGGPVHQVSYIKGSHSAGHEERHWGDIARFIVSGCVPGKDARQQNRLVRTLGRAPVSVALLGLILFIALGFGFLIGRPVICKIPKIDSVDLLRACEAYTKADLSGTDGALRTLATILYFWVIYIVVSRL